MPTANVNGVQLFYELDGIGDVPLVLVHGLWTSHHNWDLVAPRLAESFRVLTYDRRGYSQSERPAGQISLRHDIADLAALIEHLELAPSWVVGSSAGLQIALRLACEHPDLVRGVAGHEPGFFSLIADDPSFRPMLDQVDRVSQAVIDFIASGDFESAAEHFVETALGPDAWGQMPLEARQILVENAPVFVDAMKDPECFLFDPTWVKGFARPALLTTGDHSAPFLGPVVYRLAEVLPGAEVAVIPGAGHSPHNTHPDTYVELLTDFIRSQPAPADLPATSATA